MIKRREVKENSVLEKKNPEHDIISGLLYVGYVSSMLGMVNMKVLIM